MQLIGSDGLAIRAKCADRAGLLRAETIEGPMLLVDAEATAYVPQGWLASAREDGSVVLS
jgi:hypothetical protein